MTECYSPVCQRTVANLFQLSESSLSRLYPQPLSTLSEIKFNWAFFFFWPKFSKPTPPHPCWFQYWPEGLPHLQQSPGETLSLFRLSSSGLAGPGGEDT